MFEELIGSAAAGINAQVNPTSQQFSYNLNQNLTGEQYFYGFQVGGTYKVAENLSVFGGLRTVVASCNYTGAINNFKVNGIDAKNFAPAFAQAYQQAADAAKQAAAAGNAEAASQYQAAATKAGMVAQLTKEDLTLDCSQSGIGFTPIQS